MEVRAALGLGDDVPDARLVLLIPGALALAERFAGRAFVRREVVEHHAGGVRSLALRRFPVVSVEYVIDRAIGGEVPASQYAVEREQGFLTRLPYGRRWAGDAASIFSASAPSAPDIPGRWEVRYTGGPEGLPADVRAAIYEIIAASLTGAGGKQAEKDGDYSYTLAASASGMPPQAEAILRAYRSPV